MLGSGVLLVFLLWGQDSVRSVRLVELRVNAHEHEGGRTLLGCQYDMEGQVLYSVKWYKDGQEFFHFVPKNDPQMYSYPRPGVNVDMSRSSSTEVALENLTRESAGNYSCEVSGEWPSFITARGYKQIVINLLPESGPYITGLQEYYFLDQTAVMNCSSSPSRPTANLKWLLNDKPVDPSYLQGPWHRKSIARSDAFETILQLKFVVEPKHFEYGKMKLKCQASIAPLYQRETQSVHYVGLPELMTQTQNEPIGEPLSGASDTSKHSNVVSFLMSILFLLNILQ